MLTESQPKIAVTSAWKDITVANAALASADVLIQNLDDDYVDVVVGGASEPTTAGPVRLDTGEVVPVNAANIWVRGEGNISATLGSL